MRYGKDNLQNSPKFSTAIFGRIHFNHPALCQPQPPNFLLIQQHHQPELSEKEAMHQLAFSHSHTPFPCFAIRSPDDVCLSLLDVTNFNSIEAHRARDASLCEEADMKKPWPLVVLLRAAPRSSVLPCYS